MGDYNGELLALYNDIDKRLSVHERVESMNGKTHADRAEKMEEYMHDGFHDLKNDLIVISGKLDTLPCEGRKEHTKGVDGHIKALWITVSGIVTGVLTMAWRVLFDH